MAKETRIGLLVGLAFIICFAIILANRGGQSAVNSQPPYAYILNPTGAAPAGTGASVASPATPTAETTADLPRAADSRMAGGDSRPQATHQNATRQTTAAPRRLEGQFEPVKRPAQVTLSQQARLQDLLNRVDGRMANAARTASSAPGPAAATPPPAAPSGTAGRYVVQPGDSLSSIARTCYGRQTGTVVQAIFEANRSLLPSADQVKVGAVLTLPVLDEVGAPRVPAAAATNTAGRAGRGGGARPPGDQPRRDERGRVFRWYQVQPSDTYASIARSELGDGARWREIFELNKDKFPDPDRIRDGVRIKLPARR